MIYLANIELLSTTMGQKALSCMFVCSFPACLIVIKIDGKHKVNEFIIP